MSPNPLKEEIRMYAVYFTTISAFLFVVGFASSMTAAPVDSESSDDELLWSKKRPHDNASGYRTASGFAIFFYLSAALIMGGIVYRYLKGSATLLAIPHQIFELLTGRARCTPPPPAISCSPANWVCRSHSSRCQGSPPALRRGLPLGCASRLSSSPSFASDCAVAAAGCPALHQSEAVGRCRVSRAS